MVKCLIEETPDWNGYSKWEVFGKNIEECFKLVHNHKNYNSGSLSIKSKRKVKYLNQPVIIYQYIDFRK